MMVKSMTKKSWFACWVVLLSLGGGMAVAQDKNAMLAALKAGDVNNVQALLDTNPVLVQVQDRYQWTPVVRKNAVASPPSHDENHRAASLHDGARPESCCALKDERSTGEDPSGEAGTAPAPG